MLLLIGRGSTTRWHTRTCTAQSPVLRKLPPALVCVEIEPAGAKRADTRRESIHLA